MVGLSTYWLAAATIAGVVGGNLLFKIGAGRENDDEFFDWVFNWHILSGLALFGVSALLYLLLLRRMPLNVAQSFLVAQFVGVILASYFILHEPIPLLRICGIGLIVVGILVVGLSYSK